MFKDRLENYKTLEKLRNSKVLVYFTGDRPGMETQMHPEVIDRFVDHLDNFNSSKKITLILHSRGGDLSAGWSIANLIRSFCDEFEVIVPYRAHSAATLLCLGADKIIMTKQATLGPIDPSVNTPLNPPIPNAGPNARMPVSVESIKGYIELAKTEFGIKRSEDMTQVLSFLTSEKGIHPLVLGSVFRARAHIRMLAKNLLDKQLKKAKNKKLKIDKIVHFLCSDSGSHDYTINRSEARDSLGLMIEKPDDDLYRIILNIYKDIEEELQLKNRFEPSLLVSQSESQNFSCKRALIESIDYKSDVFMSEGRITKQSIQTPNGSIIQLQDHRTFEGWRRENE